MIGIVLNGQLGNQMFQYAAARWLADRLGTAVFCIGSSTTFRTGPFGDFLGLREKAGSGATRFNGLLYEAFKLGPTRLALNLSELARRPIQSLKFSRSFAPPGTLSKSGAFVESVSEDFFELPDRTLLSGWFQSSQYWRDTNFASLLYLPNSECLRLRGELEAQYGASFRDFIGLHVRRTDYLSMRHGLSHSSNGWVLPVSYYTSALRAFDDARRVLVFSDDPAWAAEVFSGSRFIVQPRRQAAIDLFLLSFCGGKIIANSSFSWWAGYLGREGSDRTVAPKFHLGWEIGEWVPLGIQQPDWQYLDAAGEAAGDGLSAGKVSNGSN